MGESSTYLDADTLVLSLSEIFGAGSAGEPSPASALQGETGALLPEVQIPGLAVATEASLGRTLAQGKLVLTGAAAHDEDLLSPPEVVDGLGQQHGVHIVDGERLVDARVVDEAAVLEEGADVAASAKVIAGHQLVVAMDEQLHASDEAVGELTAGIGRGEVAWSAGITAMGEFPSARWTRRTIAGAGWGHLPGLHGRQHGPIHTPKHPSHSGQDGGGDGGGDGQGGGSDGDQSDDENGEDPEHGGIAPLGAQPELLDPASGHQGAEDAAHFQRAAETLEVGVEAIDRLDHVVGRFDAGAGLFEHAGVLAGVVVAVAGGTVHATGPIGVAEILLAEDGGEAPRPVLEARGVVVPPTV